MNIIHFAEILKSLENGEESQTATRRASFVVERAIDDALYLFTPEGESRWEPAFRPQYVNRDKDPASGRFFFTHGEGQDADTMTLWTLADYQTENHRLVYVRLKPKSDVATITIELEAISPTETLAHISYYLVGLCEEGNKYIRSMDDESYKAWIHEWDLAIRRYLGDR